MIYDLGGGTLAESILTIEDVRLEVSATVCDTHLGGSDFDYRIMDVGHAGLQEAESLQGHGWELARNQTVAHPVQARKAHVSLPDAGDH